MGIQITGSNDTIQAADGNLSIEGVSLNFNHENVTGISTMATGHITGTATIDDDLKVGVSTFFVDKSAGRIGIGTVVPAGLLEIDAASTTDMIMFDVSGVNFAKLGHNSSGGVALLDVRTEGHMRFLTNGNNERLRITSTGTVGINTSVTSTANSGFDDLVIRAPAGGNTGITFLSGATNQGTLAFADGGSSTEPYRGYIQYSHNGDKLVLGAGGGDRVTVGQTGDVDITGITTAAAYSTSSGQQIANRNILHNGAMTINQRDTASQVTILYPGYYTVDRWKYSASGGNSGTWTMTHDTDVPDGQGFHHSLKTDCQVANASPDAGDYVLLTQVVEGFNLQRFNKGTSDAKTMTLSFWAKSTLTGNFVAELNDNDNSRTVSALFQTTTSWKKHVITFPADTTGAFGDDNGLSLYVNFWLSAGSTYTSGTLATTWASATDANRAVGVQNLMSSTSNNFWVTGVQLEAGSVATPFEFTKYGHELATSQRYYYRNSGNKIVIFNDYNNSTSNFWAQMYLPVTMRAAPTATVTTIAAGAITSTSTSIDMLSFNASNGATHFDNSTVIEASAEL